MADDFIPRRGFLVGAGTALAAGLASPAPVDAQTAQTASTAPADAEPLLTLTATEAAFFAAAADTMIPADELSPSGSECGVAFIDRQLAGAYGTGARLYREGPFRKGKPEQGYQLSLNPREFFRAGIASANELTRKTYGKDFDRLKEAEAKPRSRRWRPARPSLRDLAARCSSTRCCRSPWRASSPIRCTAAIATWPRGRWSDIPACRRLIATTSSTYLGKVYDKPPRSIADFS